MRQLILFTLLMTSLAFATTPIGAKADGQKVTGYAITATSAALSCAACTFSAEDIGKLFDLNGAGVPSCGYQYYAADPPNSMNCNLVGTIASFVDAHNVTLSVPAGTTVQASSGLQIKWCSDDTAVLQTWLSTGGTLYLPAGFYCVSAKIQAALTNSTVYGDGMNASQIWQMGVVAYNQGTVYPAIVFDSGSAHVLVHDIGIDGTDALGELGRTLGQYGSHGWLLCGGAVSGPCLASTSSTDITLNRVYFGHIWGGGFVANSPNSPTNNINNLTIANSFATGNGWDGFNPNIYDGLIMYNDTGIGNGTGGLETATIHRVTVRGGAYDHNNVGLSIGGGAIEETALVTGVEASYNGFCGTTNSAGYGIITGAGQYNVTLDSNMVRRNCNDGIILESSAGTLVQNNTVWDNGQSPWHGGNAPVGIVGAGPGTVLQNNDIEATGISGFLQNWAIQIGSNVQGLTLGPETITGNQAYDYYIEYNVQCIYTDSGKSPSYNNSPTTCVGP
jgi:parallel beta-helix repeat protein